MSRCFPTSVFELGREQMTGNHQLLVELHRRISPIDSTLIDQKPLECTTSAGRQQRPERWRKLQLLIRPMGSKGRQQAVAVAMNAEHGVCSDRCSPA